MHREVGTVGDESAPVVEVPSLKVVSTSRKEWENEVPEFTGGVMLLEAAKMNARYTGTVAAAGK